MSPDPYIIEKHFDSKIKNSIYNAQKFKHVNLNSSNFINIYMV